MAGELKVEILFRGDVYVLGADACAKLLVWLEREEPEIGAVFATLRGDLRKALRGEPKAIAGVTADDGEEEEPPVPREAPKAVLKSVAQENVEACGDCRAPRCRFCDKPGTRAGGRKDGAGRTVERYYVCETAGCIAAKIKTPQPMGLFSGGGK